MIARARPSKTATKQTPVAGQIFDVAIGDIKPAQENDKLYKPVSARDPAQQALAVSIRDNGLREEIVLSLDDYIISGHRRFLACRMNRMKFVRCRYENVWHDSDPDGFLTLLREHNRQRVKSLDEQIREAVVDANPDDAMNDITEYRRGKETGS